MQKELCHMLECTGRGEHEIRYFDVIDSTNTWLKNAALEGAPDGMVVIAEHQTAGRGRMTRVFESPKGKGLYLSVLLRPNLPLERLIPITALTGVAVSNAVERICGVRPGLKWPNDLILGNRKLCGILTEMVFDENASPCIILGIGMNVLHQPEDFTAEVGKIATSLLIQTNTEVSKLHLAAALIQEIDTMYEVIKAGDVEAYRSAYRRDCVNLGKEVQLMQADGTHVAAEAVDIDEAFGLLIRTKTGEQRCVCTGEVSVRGLYGYID